MAPHNPLFAASAPFTPFTLLSCLPSSTSSDPCALTAPSLLFHPLLLAVYVLALFSTTHSAFSVRGVRPSVSLLITLLYPLLIRNISLGASVAWATGVAGPEVLGRYLLPAMEMSAVNVLSGAAVVGTVLMVLYDLDFRGRVKKNLNKSEKEKSWFGGAGGAEVGFLMGEAFLLFSEGLVPLLFWITSGSSIHTFAQELHDSSNFEIHVVSSSHINLSFLTLILSLFTLTLFTTFLLATTTHAALSLIVQRLPSPLKVVSSICYYFVQAVLYAFLASVILTGYFLGLVTMSRAIYVAALGWALAAWWLVGDDISNMVRGGWESWVMMGASGAKWAAAKA